MNLILLWLIRAKPHTGFGGAKAGFIILFTPFIQKTPLETLVTNKVSLVLCPFMIMSETNTKVRIRDKAREMFMRYGIRSVSMDDIATQLGMSKKTIYQYFTDKNDLVDMVVDADVQEMRTDCTSSGITARDAVDEIFLTIERVVEQFRNINPVVIYDLEKFHVRSYQRWMEYKNKFLLQVIRQNLERGIAEGLYRPEISIDILSKFRLESIMVAFNIDLYPPSKYNFADVTKEIIEHYVFGIASLKGYRLILRYQKKSNKKVKKTENIIFNQ